MNAPLNASIAVVLVEPAGPRNVGGVARACANFSGGPLQLQLRLVAPRCDHLGEEALQMAVHGLCEGWTLTGWRNELVLIAIATTPTRDRNSDGR